MPKWIGVITNDGNDLLSEWANEKTLNFDKVIFGTGTVAVEAMLAQSDLVSQKQVAGIVGSERVDSGIRLKIQVTAADVGYELNQIGVWASVEDAEPVMLALYQYTTGFPVPSKSESPEFVYTFYALISTSNQGQWNVNVDTSALVTREQFDAHALDKNNPHGMTREQLGAAPAGYGLGGTSTIITDWNTATANGFYADRNGTAEKHSPFIGMAAWGYTIAFTQDDAITQVAFTYATPNWKHALCQKVRHLKGAVGWSEWEWVNPPLEVSEDAEYRTTERIKGKAVYKRLNSNGALEYRLDGESTWYPYINHIGAAPAGYGLGKEVGHSCGGDPNKATLSGIYTFGDNPINIPPQYPNFKWGTLLVDRRYGLVNQTLKYNYITAVRSGSSQDGESWSWSPWEFVNPPTVYNGDIPINTEYRTTERFYGSPVYMRALDFKSGVDGTKTMYIAETIGDLVRIEGFWQNKTDKTVKYPFTTAPWVDYVYVGTVEGESGIRLIVRTVAAGASYLGFPVVYYTKREV